MRLRSALLLCLVLGSGCAFTQADLPIEFDPATAHKGPLSEAQPVTLEFAPLNDARIDRNRIGHKKNGFGQNTADVQALRPVTEIVRDALRATLEANGHREGTPGAVRVEGDVTQFWFDTQTNFWTVEFMGTVECKLRFVDATSGATLHEGSYTGHYNEKSGGGYEKSWTRVMNLALGRLTEAVANDAKLGDALKARGSPAPAPVAEATGSPATH